jgi:hypothetical protein
MGSKKAIHEKEIIKVIEKNNLFVIQDIFAFYSGIKSSQFYNLELEKSESIIKAIDDNKSKTKQSLKNKWYKSDNATLQIALYKSICTDSERRALAQNYTDHSSEDGSMTPIIGITFDNEK